MASHMNNVQELPVKGSEPASGQNKQEAASARPEANGGPPRDYGKLSLIVSLLSLVLVVIFFFGLNRNLSGLSNEVQDYGQLKNTVVSLDAYVDDILGQMGKINAQMLDMDARQREVAARLLLDSMLDDMLQKTSFLKAQFVDAPEAAKLAQLQTLLLEMRHPGAAVPELAPSVAPEAAGPTEAAPPAAEESQDIPAVAPTPEPEDAPAEGLAAPEQEGLQNLSDQERQPEIMEQ